ncbi:MAG: TonB-dependent receptor [Marinifilaceae bacterium]|jgi:outer membrane receptor for ferrienterochelin and colicins|nr:TonB-dependent receptor [Marinifilaceae bacterium]
MKNLSKLLIITITLMIANFAYAIPKKHTDANIIGHVVCKGEHIPFATISLIGTTVGTATDATGHFQLNNMSTGKVKVKAQAVGYKPQIKEIELKAGKTIELKFTLTEDVLGLEEVVVTGDRSETSRTESSTIVNTLSPKLFSVTQSSTLSEGLKFAPGLRLENNCQNCGFTQIRMNGMEGPYSQILINSKAIFSGLAGVYGLELIPSNMIDRVEVVRGGGSALYGSNAIAGTINLILKDPVNNSFEFGANSSFIGVGQDNSGGISEDYKLDFNTSLVTSDGKTGMALYGYYRDRSPFDANDDGFSEISSVDNTTLGTRVFHRFSSRNKLALDFFNIKENRRGGDSHSHIEHDAEIAEAVKHNITTAALTYDQFFREIDKLSVYASAQKVDRDSYYGAGKSLSDYGKTEGLTYTVGAQYDANFDISKLTVGVENVGDYLDDKKMGYPDLENISLDSEGKPVINYIGNTQIADQEKNVFGAFAQYELKLNKFTVSAGARFDRYDIKDKTHNDGSGDTDGNVFSPRLTLKYDIFEYLQARGSFSKGYRAPQLFDEDLHIEASTSRKIIHKNSPKLEQETSNSYMASLDFNKKIGNTSVGILAEGFVTKLDNPFINERSDPDANGVTTYTRINAKDGAEVKGINLEFNIIPSIKYAFKGGLTIQKSEYENAAEVDFNEKKFLRTPEKYGFFTFEYKPTKKFNISASGNYTGSMLVPYHGPKLGTAEKMDAGIIKESDDFFDLGIKFDYTMKINGAKMKFIAGMKNIFNSYQDDFDKGGDRDPAYIYGPLNPRTIYFGIKIGNLL